MKPAFIGLILVAAALLIFLFVYPTSKPTEEEEEEEEIDTVEDLLQMLRDGKITDADVREIQNRPGSKTLREWRLLEAYVIYRAEMYRDELLEMAETRTIPVNVIRSLMAKEIAGTLSIDERAALDVFYSLEIARIASLRLKAITGTMIDAEYQNLRELVYMGVAIEGTQEVIDLYLAYGSENYDLWLTQAQNGTISSSVIAMLQDRLNNGTLPTAGLAILNAHRHYLSLMEFLDHGETGPHPDDQNIIDDTGNGDVITTMSIS